LIKKVQVLIKDEFDQHEVGHSTFKVQKEMKHMIARLEEKVINEINTIKVGKSTGLNDKKSSTSQLIN